MTRAPFTQQGAPAEAPERATSAPAARRVSGFPGSPSLTDPSARVSGGLLLPTAPSAGPLRPLERVARTLNRRVGGRLVGSGSPAALRVDGERPRVLALHGFGGTPAEVAVVVDVARELGLAAAAPLLPGHGTSPAELAETRYDDWLAASGDALDELSPDGAPAVVVGFSLGSLLALDLALARPDAVGGLALLGNALWLSKPFPALALGLVDALGLPDLWLPKAGGPDLGDPAAKRTHLTYDVQPSLAAIEVFRAGRRLRAELGRITCPTLIVHGARDAVCPVANAERVARALTNAVTERVVLPRSKHIITRDVDRAELAAALRRFLAARQRDLGRAASGT